MSKSLTRSITAFGCVLVLLDLVSALSPSGLNWGVHVLAFLPPAFRFGIPVLMLLALVPAIQDALLGVVQLIAQKARETPRLVWGVLIVAFVAGAIQLFWVGREQTFLLGDGRLTMRNLSDVHSVDVLPVGFKNAPLPGYVVWKLFLFLKSMKIEPAPLLAFRFVSMAMGALSFLVLLPLVKRLSTDSVEQILAWLFIVASAGSQIFFGYVEAYAPSYFALLLFTWLSLLYLDEKIHLVLPSVAFGLLLVCHFGMVFMAPAILYLLYHGFTRRGPAECIVSLVALAATVVSILWVSGYTLELFEAVFLQESGTHIVPLAGPVSGWQAYALLSPWHVLDLLNLYALIAPFSVAILLALAGIAARKFRPGNGHWMFFTLMGMGGVAFSILMNFDIGMSRDWDLLSPYILAMVVAAAFFWMNGVESPVMRRRLMAMMIVITVSCTSAYIFVNASEERALARFSMLPDARLWGNSAQAYAYEDLSAYYRDRKEPVPASLFAQKCLLADSTNSRRWLNASVVFLNSGDKDREIHAYEKAIQLGTGVAWAYGNLGSEYIKMGRVDEAALLLRKALELDPQLPMAAYNLGSLLGSSKHEHREALSYLLRAVETDSTFPLAWLNVGTCLYEMGKYDEMIPYYERFLQLSPDDPTAPAIRQLVATVRTKH